MACVKSSMLGFLVLAVLVISAGPAWAQGMLVVSGMAGVA
jgi:hypothetical protein